MYSSEKWLSKEIRAINVIIVARGLKNMRTRSNNNSANISVANYTKHFVSHIIIYIDYAYSLIEFLPCGCTW